jgi:hypothetical protein
MITATAQKRAVGYLRVSDLKQTGEHHSSLETQDTRFREYCQRHGLAPVATFTTNPVIKGTLVYGRKPRKGNPRMELVEVPHFFPSILSAQEWLTIRREMPPQDRVNNSHTK